MEKPLVSIVVPTYNRATEVVRAVESALSQTYQKVEIIISDDGSKDETALAVADLIKQNGSKIIYVRSETNQGVSAARNRGIEKAGGDYIAFLDSDDAWEPDKIEVQLAIAQNLGEDAFVFCVGKVLNKNLNVVQMLTNERQEGPCFYAVDGTPLNDNPFEVSIPPPSTWFISASFVSKAGLFDESMRSFEDPDLAYRLYRARFKGYFINRPLVNFFEGGTHLSEMSMKSVIAKEVMVKKFRKSLSRKNTARIYNSLSKDYSYFSNRKMASYSLLRAFFTYPLNQDYLGRAVRIWFWIRTRSKVC